MKQIGDEKIQSAYNKKHGIVPKTIIKEINDISASLEHKPKRSFDSLTKKESIKRMMKELESQMDIATQNLDFENAAILRDELEVLEQKLRKS